MGLPGAHGEAAAAGPAPHKQLLRRLACAEAERDAALAAAGALEERLRSAERELRVATSRPRPGSSHAASSHTDSLDAMPASALVRRCRRDATLCHATL